LIFNGSRLFPLCVNGFSVLQNKHCCLLGADHSSL